MFKHLREVIGKCGFPIPKNLQGIPEKCFKAVGAFVVNESVGHVLVDFHETAARAGLAWGEAAKGEAVDRQA